MTRIATLSILTLLLAGCQGAITSAPEKPSDQPLDPPSVEPTDPPSVEPTDPIDPGSTGTPSSQNLGLQYNGATSFVLLSSKQERVDISAPLLPYYGSASTNIEGSFYPQDQAERIAYVQANTYTFEELRDKCAPDYPGIVLQQPGDPPLTKEQIASNYDLVAKCSYERYAVKPYWIPQLVDDVDVCAVKLGADWRLIAEHDLQSFSDAEYRYIQETLSGTPAAGIYGSFYFSLHDYVRGNDGTLKAGDLTPGVAEHVTAIVYAPWEGPKYHYEGALVPRCIRRAPTPGQ